MNVIPAERKFESAEDVRRFYADLCQPETYYDQPLRERAEAEAKEERERQAHAPRQRGIDTAAGNAERAETWLQWFNAAFDFRINKTWDKLLDVFALERAHGDKADKALRAEIAALRSELEAAKGEIKRIKNLPGKLPPVRTWVPQTVGYENDLFCHAGAFWQATKDAAQEPGTGTDWLLLSRAGRDGASPTPRGEYDPHDAYSRLDIVTRNGHLYTCVRENPGVPGQCDDWMLLASRRPAGAPARPARAGTRETEGRAAPRSKSGGSTASIFALSHFTATEAQGRRCACANCLKNVRCSWRRSDRVPASLLQPAFLRGSS